MLFTIYTNLYSCAFTGFPPVTDQLSLYLSVYWWVVVVLYIRNYVVLIVFWHSRKVWSQLYLFHLMYSNLLCHPHKEFFRPFFSTNPFQNSLISTLLSWRWHDVPFEWLHIFVFFSQKSFVNHLQLFSTSDLPEILFFVTDIVFGCNIKQFERFDRKSNLRFFLSIPRRSFSGLFTSYCFRAAKKHSRS